MALLVVLLVFLVTAIYVVFFCNLCDTKKPDKLKEKRFENFLLKKVDLSVRTTETQGKKKTLSPLERLKQEVFQHASPSCTGTKRVIVAYGTEYGFSREVAKKIAERLSQHFGTDSISVRLLNLLHWEIVDWKREELTLVACSTTGDGVLPNEAKDFYDGLKEKFEEGELQNLNFAVLALGDRGYPHFCRAGKLIEETLKNITGKESIVARGEVDQEDWPVIEDWIDNVIGCLDNKDLLTVTTSADYLEEALDMKFGTNDVNGYVGSTFPDAGHSKENPFLAKVLERRLLTKYELSDDKEVLHIELDLSNSGIQYTPGDALAVLPTNCPKQVERLLVALGATGEEELSSSDNSPISLKNILTYNLDIKNVKPELLMFLRQCAYSDNDLKVLDELLDVEKGGLSKKNEVLRGYLASREVYDVLAEFSSASVDLQKFVQHLRPLSPRYYSISSSSLVDSNRVSITVAVVRYELLGLDRVGVATTYLADRVDIGNRIPVFLSKNDNFRLPSNGSTPIIMIGPGTVRVETYYFLAVGTRTVIFSFSRDQPKKIYVQDVMLEQSAFLWSLLEQGAHVYVCGDGTRMANDVHEAWLRIISSHRPGCSREDALEFMEALERNSRYQRDVWIT
ncbi:NADPH oxidoreductase A [Galdieria sulphuraria]|nr:NADPH oxidoreductase A [Galdieria sulphuraria]